MTACHLDIAAPKKTAETSYPLNTLLAERWSPRAFKESPLSLQQIGSLLEAARWSASCFNAQPWRIFVGSKEYSPETWDKIFDTLVEFNQQWAKPCPLLVLTVARNTFPHNGQPNAHGWHDVGMATASMTLQAMAMGLHAHSMAGFDIDKAYTLFDIPRGGEYEPVAVTAFGVATTANELSDKGMREREEAPRERNAIQTFAFAESFEKPFSACFN